MCGRKCTSILEEEVSQWEEGRATQASESFPRALEGCMEGSEKPQMATKSVEVLEGISKATKKQFRTPKEQLNTG